MAQPLIGMGGCGLIPTIKGMGIMCDTDLSTHPTVLALAPAVAEMPGITTCDICAATCAANGQNVCGGGAAWREKARWAQQHRATGTEANGWGVKEGCDHLGGDAHKPGAWWAANGWWFYGTYGIAFLLIVGCCCRARARSKARAREFATGGSRQGLSLEMAHRQRPAQAQQGGVVVSGTVVGVGGGMAGGAMPVVAGTVVPGGAAASPATGAVLTGTVVQGTYVQQQPVPVLTGTVVQQQQQQPTTIAATATAAVPSVPAVMPSVPLVGYQPQAAGVSPATVVVAPVQGTAISIL